MDNKSSYVTSGIGSKIADIIIYTILTLMSLIMLLPFYNVLILSFASYKDIMTNPLYLFPKSFDFTAYKLIFQDKTILSAFTVSIFVTVVGTIVCLAITTLTAYALSKKDLPGRGIIFGFIIFTMYFGGGLIPWYLVVKSLGLIDKISVMIIPSVLNTFYMILMKNYFLTIPDSLEESARIDGANDLTILFRIIIPIAAPIIATISLFYAVDKWNEWWSAMLFISSPNKMPLQIILRKVVIEATIDLGSNMANTMRNANLKVYPKAIQMATVVVTAVPILLVYPFLQKHFTKGILLGSIKA